MFLIAAVLLPAALAATQIDSLLVIRHVHVLPMTGRTADVLADHAVIIRDGMIDWIGPDSALSVPAVARIIDGAGRTLMPGLIDMHAHVAESYLPLFLANGITTVRDMNGSPQRLRLRRRIQAGEVAGPTLFVGSPLLTGQSWPFGHIILPDPDSARTAAARLIADGYDFLKIYDGLSAETYAALIASARAHNLPVTGHIPAAIGLDGVLAAGQHLEHVEKIVWATVGHEPDTMRIADIVARIARAGVHVTPTLYAQKVLTSQGTAEFEALFERAETQLMDAETLAWWRSLRRNGPTQPQDPTSMGARTGVPLLLGTDTPNPHVVPGFGIHDEIAALTDGGIPIYDVLRSGTVAAAAHLGRRGRLGVIAEGAAADLVLLRGDPLVEPGTLRAPAAVIVRGRWYDGDSLRDQSERNATNGSTRAAFHAGNALAARAESRSSVALTTSVTGSVVVTPKSSERNTPVSRSAPAIPITSPRPTMRSAPPTTILRMLCGAAPRATRTPISRLRCATISDITPKMPTAASSIAIIAKAPMSTV
jgi:imidazolonepropionase-like amidohydrolase